MTFSFNRSILSYTKIQNILSWFLRNNKIQLFRLPKNKKYLDVGCGQNLNSKFICLDYNWMPGIDLCWDITKGRLPFNDSQFDGIFTEHCLEHISFDQFNSTLNEFFRILKPNGVLRIIMPDGELYLDIYQRRKNGELVRMPYEEGYISPMARINGIFRNHGHQFIYDFSTVKILLENSGFKDVKKRGFMEGINTDLLIDTEFRSVESLYVECRK